MAAIANIIKASAAPARPGTPGAAITLAATAANPGMASQATL